MEVKVKKFWSINIAKLTPPSARMNVTCHNIKSFSVGEFPDKISHPPHCEGKDPIDLFISCFSCKTHLQALLTWDVQLLAIALIYTHLMLFMGKKICSFPWAAGGGSELQHLRLKGWKAKTVSTVLKITKNGFGPYPWKTWPSSHPHTPGHVPLVALLPNPLSGCPLAPCSCPFSSRIMI